MRQIHFMVMIRGLLALDSGCPSCKSLYIRRSQRRTDWERMLGVLVLPHRCRKCELRFPAQMGQPAGAGGGLGWGWVKRAEGASANRRPRAGRL